MAKKKMRKLITRFYSTAGTGTFYNFRLLKSLRNKKQFVKYDPRIRKRVLFTYNAPSSAS